jgi:hypothetical protein
VAIHNVQVNASNYEGSERGNTDAMTFDKTPRAGYVSSGNGFATGLQFFGGGLGFSVLLVIYAALKNGDEVRSMAINIAISTMIETRKYVACLNRQKAGAIC